MIAAGLNLVMTVIGFAVSTMFIIFVCTRLIFARIQVRASRRSFLEASRSNLSILERGIHGLDPVLVSSFPTKKFNDHYKSRQDIQCIVCLSEYQEKDLCRVLPYCGHAFHVNCIDTWLMQHSTCPVCRISMQESPERERIMRPPQNAVRSHENYESDSYHNENAGHNLSPGITDNQIIDQFASEPSRVYETQVNCSVKVRSDHDSEGKNMESPSHS